MPNVRFDMAIMFPCLEIVANGVSLDLQIGDHNNYLFEKNTFSAIQGESDV